MTRPGFALLDAATISRLANLELRARAVVEGALSGMHRSPHHGGSVEFAEHKEYAEGDEIRSIDWKAYGRLDKYYVKRFEEETQLRAYLLVDVSASMRYAGGRAGVSKLAYATYVAAALAYLLLRQQDQVGVVAAGEGIRAYLPPRGRSGHLGDVLRALEALSADGPSDLARAVSQLSELARRRSIVVVLSDLLGPAAAALPLLRRLRARRHEVVVLQLLDDDELDFPFREVTHFEALEGGRELLVDARAARDAYLRELRRFLDATRRSCAEGDVGYHLVPTSRPPAQAVLDLLRARGRRPLAVG